MKHIQSVTKTIFGGISALLLILGTGTPTFAATAGGGSVQPYSSDAVYQTGTIVQLQKSSTTEVTIAQKANIQNMFGVTIDQNSQLITTTGGDLKNQTYIAVSGTYPVLVSTENGAINSGDYVTLSSLNGVADKSGTTEKTVLGRAAQSFDGKGVTLGTATIKDTTGKTNKTVALGLISVTINIQRNPNIQSTKVDVPPFLQKLGQQIAQKQVSPIRIYLSIGITGLSIIAAIAMLYAGVRNAIISIGRNPMSRKSIFRALLQVILTGVLILIIGLFAVYLLLKL